MAGDKIQEQIINTESHNESPEIRRLIGRVQGLCQMTSLKLSLNGIALKSETIESKIIPILESILDNPYISKNPKLLATVERHARDFLMRLTGLNSTKVSRYQEQRGIFEDISYDENLAKYTTEQKDKLALQDILQNGMDASFLPQMELLNRAFQKRALQYDYENWSNFHGGLSRIDGFLPKGSSVLDFILDRGKEGTVNISKDQRLKVIGMEYIVDKLNPPGAIWLKQMARNGNIGAATRVPGYTDAKVDGKNINVVNALIAFSAYVQNFQLKEIELNSIRNIAQGNEADIFIPRESKEFPEITPTSEFTEQGIIEAARAANNWTQTQRLLLKVIGASINAEYFAAGVTGINHNGILLNNKERIQGIIEGGVKVAILTILIGKVVKFIGTAAWNIGTKQLKALISICKQYLPNTGLSEQLIKKLPKSV